MFFFLLLAGGEPNGQKRTQSDMGTMQDKDPHSGAKVQTNQTAQPAAGKVVVVTVVVVVVAVFFLLLLLYSHYSSTILDFGIFRFW